MPLQFGGVHSIGLSVQLWINYSAVCPGTSGVWSDGPGRKVDCSCSKYYDGSQGPGGARVQLCSGMQTQPHHHLPNITTCVGSVIDSEAS